MKEKVETIHSKLDEIYQWFKMNMSGQNTNKSADSGECRASPETGGDMLTFELHSDLPSTGLQTLICPRASFGNGWFGKIQSSTAAAYIFQCRCCAKPHQTQLQFSCESSNKGEVSSTWTYRFSRSACELICPSTKR